MTHILIAEDDAAIRKLVGAVLRKQGIHTAAVEDGAQALRHIAAEPVDGLILDLMMPRLSGWGVVDELLRRGSPLLARTIVLTAASDGEVARLPPGLHIVRKPFDIQQLVQLVSEVIVAPAAIAAEIRDERLEIRSGQSPLSRL
jgi:CheY-like chemotaxis protein